MLKALSGSFPLPIGIEALEAQRKGGSRRKFEGRAAAFFRHAVRLIVSLTAFREGCNAKYQKWRWEMISYQSPAKYSRQPLPDGSALYARYTALAESRARTRHCFSGHNAIPALPTVTLFSYSCSPSRRVNRCFFFDDLQHSPSYYCVFCVPRRSFRWNMALRACLKRKIAPPETNCASGGAMRSI